jgi:hypothetical protein
LTYNFNQEAAAAKGFAVCGDRIRGWNRSGVALSRRRD